MRMLVRLTALIAALLLVSGAPAYARGGGGGGGHAFGGGHGFGGGHSFGGPHAGAFGGHGGFDGHHGFDRHHDFDGHHRFHGHFFVGAWPWFYWGPYWDPFWSYGPYAYTPSPTIVEPPAVYIEKPQPGYWYYCQSEHGYYPNVPSCAEPWVRVAPRAG